MNSILNAVGLMIMVICLRELWTSLYSGGTGTADGISLEQMLTYSTISVMMSSLMVRSYVDLISGAVRDGTIIIDLMRPWSFFGYMLSRVTGLTLSNGITRTFPLMVFASIIYGTSFFKPANIGMSIVSIILAIFTLFLLNFLVSMAAFFLVEVWGLDIFITVFCINLLSGHIIPIHFFPEALKQLLFMLPFRSLYDIPLGIYTGIYEGNTIWEVLLFQLTWIFILYVVSQLCFAMIRKKIVISGG